MRVEPTAALRGGGGCTDTDQNGADFAAGGPNPRNTATPASPCSAGTNPTGIGSASPSNVLTGYASLLTVAVTPGGNPTSTALAVTVNLSLPVPRLMPVALVAPERRLMVTPVCAARPLAHGRPPMGIACAQQDVVHVYPLPDDPERCLIDFAERAAEHARRLAERLEHQEASVRRFLELNGEDFGAAA